MNSAANFIAIDLGASSGRVLAGQWDGHRFTLEELHRFSNQGVSILGTIYWDVLRIWTEIETGLSTYQARFGAAPAGISVDAWGVDFAFLDRQGKLTGNPVHYRDARTNGMVSRVMEKVSAESLYRHTAVQTMQINTIFQLYSMVLSNSSELATAHTFLMIPDLFNYFLSGEKAVEYSQATTTQIFSAVDKEWAHKLLQPLALPMHVLPRIVYPGTVLGNVVTEVYEKAGFRSSFPVLVGASHDTASAVAGTPNLNECSAFLSSGTWSLMGVESRAITNSDEAFKLNFTNEGGVDGSVLLLKNITGLWLLQECQRQWVRQGQQLDWQYIFDAAAEAAPFRSLLFPDAADFHAPASMPVAIQNYCRRNAQPVPESVGEIARACLESLCLRYRAVLDELRLVTGRELRTIHVVGGGSQNPLLSQWTADACECDVVCGPVEASALGNVMMQAVTTGHLSGVAAGRAAISASVDCTTWHPRPGGNWQSMYFRFQQVDHGRVE